MTSRRTSPRPMRARRRQPSLRAADPLPDAPAAAEEELQAAEQLVEDLFALVDLGLLSPVREIGGVRYAVGDDRGVG